MSEQAIQVYIERLPDKQPGIALDIGANHGMYTSQIARKFEHVYAFECEPTNLGILSHNISKPNVTVIPKAVGKVNGKIKLFKCPPNMGAHSTCEAHPQLGTWGHTPDNWIWVPSVTLDTFWESIKPKPIKFIKCDIEGAESFVFDYAEKLFTENKLTMIIEVHRTVDLEHLYDLFAEKFKYKAFYLDSKTIGSSLQFVQNHEAGQEADLFGYDIHYRVTNEV